MSDTVQVPDWDIVHANAYAIAFRLLGNRVDALDVATRVADQTVKFPRSGANADWNAIWADNAQSLTANPTNPHRGEGDERSATVTTFGSASSPIAWLSFAALESVDQSLKRPMTHEVDLESPTRARDQQRVQSMRLAVRRRLENSTRHERIAGSLVHLSGYPSEFVARAMGVDEDLVLAWSTVLAPPPNMSYRQLGDPDMTHEEHFFEPDSPWWKRHMFTLAVVILVLIAAFWMTRLSGERPTFGPELDPDSVVTFDNGTVTDYLPPDYLESGDAPTESSSMTD